MKEKEKNIVVELEHLSHFLSGVKSVTDLVKVDTMIEQIDNLKLVMANLIDYLVSENEYGIDKYKLKNILSDILGVHYE